MPIEEPPTGSVRFYWRPGCPFCGALRLGLRRRGVPFTEVNIWEDPAAAAFVRSVAGGCETVPTVAVGGRALVNPSAAAVVEAVRAELPSLAPAADGGGPVRRLLGRRSGTTRPD